MDPNRLVTALTSALKRGELRRSAFVASVDRVRALRSNLGRSRVAGRS